MDKHTHKKNRGDKKSSSRILFRKGWRVNLIILSFVGLGFTGYGIIHKYAGVYVPLLAILAAIITAFIFERKTFLGSGKPQTDSEDFFLSLLDELFETRFIILFFVVILSEVWESSLKNETFTRADAEISMFVAICFELFALAFQYFWSRFRKNKLWARGNSSNN